MRNKRTSVHMVENEDHLGTWRGVHVVEHLGHGTDPKGVRA